MATTPHLRDAFLKPEAQEEVAIKDGDTEIEGRRRYPDLFTAVAGHVSVRGYKSRAKKSNSDLPKDNLQSLYPEEVLYKSINAPDRFHERDAYWADRYLSPDQTLPDSDLLKGIHAYASDIYGRATSDGGKTDVRSLNETALLAFGILLEEAAGQMLGRTGDLALVEGEPIPSRARKPQNVRESRSRTRSPSQVPSSSGLDAVPSRKRRKLDA